MGREVIKEAIEKINRHVYGRKNVSGAIRCPGCGGILRFSIGHDGAVLACCGTQSCLSFEEGGVKRK